MAVDFNDLRPEMGRYGMLWTAEEKRAFFSPDERAGAIAAVLNASTAAEQKAALTTAITGFAVAADALKIVSANRAKVSRRDLPTVSLRTGDVALEDRLASIQVMDEFDFLHLDSPRFARGRIRAGYQSADEATRNPAFLVLDRRNGAGEAFHEVARQGTQLLGPEARHLGDVVAQTLINFAYSQHPGGEIHARVAELVRDPAVSA